MNRVLDRIIAFETRYKRWIDLAGAAAMLASGMAYAGFITLPRIPYFTEQQLFWISAGFNSLWWGCIRPVLHVRKQTLDQQASESQRSSEGIGELGDELDGELGGEAR